MRKGAILIKYSITAVTAQKDNKEEMYYKKILNKQKQETTSAITTEMANKQHNKECLEAVSIVTAGKEKEVE